MVLQFWADATTRYVWVMRQLEIEAIEGLKLYKAQQFLLRTRLKLSSKQIFTVFFGSNLNTIHQNLLDFVLTAAAALHAVIFFIWVHTKSLSTGVDTADKSWPHQTRPPRKNKASRFVFNFFILFFPLFFLL